MITLLIFTKIFLLLIRCLIVIVLYRKTIEILVTFFCHTHLPFRGVGAIQPFRQFGRVAEVMLPVFMRIVGSVVYHARLVPSTCEFRTAQLVQGARVGTTLVFPCWHQLIYLARYDDSVNLLHAPSLLSCDTGNRGRG